MNKKTFDSKKLWNKPKKSPKRSGSKKYQTFAPNIDKIAKILSPKAEKNLNQSDLKTEQKPKSNLIHRAQKYYINLKLKFYGKDWFRRFNYQLLSFAIFKKLNVLVVLASCLSLVLFFVYLAFFDQNFVIRDYKITFAPNSYLNQQQTRKLVTQFHTQKLYGILPNNQYWFMNSVGLTQAAKQIFPEIQSVQLTNRNWPNSAELKIDMSPIAMTLAVKENNDQKFWRISSSGSVLGEDKAGMWEKLVVVEKPYTIIAQDSLAGKNKTSLQNFSFINEPNQLARIEQTDFLWQVFKDNDINIISTIYPSISDTDIVFKTDEGTSLYFDSSAFSTKLQQARLTEFMQSKVGDRKIIEQEKDGKLSYIDFRIPKRIFFCDIGTKCSL